MARNEADLIGHTIQHLLDQGVAHVLVADHLSTDDTPVILEGFGDQVTRASYTHPGYYQSAVMTLLARHAAQSGARWIVPFDADELWWAPGQATLASFLSGTPNEIVRGAVWRYVPTAADDPDEPNPFVRIRHRVATELPDVKVAFRASRRATVAMGNHGVRRPGTSSEGLIVAHYQYRSLDHMRRKVRDGIAAVQQADVPHPQHWRALAAKDDAALDDYWQAMVTTGLINDPAALALRNRPA
jgi:glycosyltransferase involved in cell wall biosynthesis